MRVLPFLSVFEMDVAASLVATLLATVVGYVLAVVRIVVRRRLRGSGFRLEGLWQCESRITSSRSDRVAVVRICITRRLDGRHWLKSNGTGDNAWNAVGEIGGDEKHLMLTWKIQEGNQNLPAGVSVLFVETSGSFMAGHWYGENRDGAQTLGWSLFYRVKSVEKIGMTKRVGRFIKSCLPYAAPVAGSQGEIDEEGRADARAWLGKQLGVSLADPQQPSR